MPRLSRIAILFAGLIAVLAAMAFPAAAKPPLEAFGDAPEIRAMDLSPDGQRVAFISRIKNVDYLVMHEFATKTSKPLVAVDEIRARAVNFIDNNYIVLIASSTERFYGFRGRLEYSAAFAYSISTGKIIQLLARTDRLFPAQSGLGRIVGMHPDGKHVYMPAYMGERYSDPSLDLLEVDLETGRGQSRTSLRGLTSTIDWIVGANGEVIAREDFNKTRRTHEIRSYALKDDAQKIYSVEADSPSTNLVGVSLDGKSLITVDSGDSEFLSLYQMSIADGTISGPILKRDDGDIDSVLVDGNRVVHGVRYSGMTPQYDLFDPELQKDVKTAQAYYPDASVFIASWTADWSKILLHIEGGSGAERYVLFDRKARKMTSVSQGRPSIKPKDVGEVVTIEYKARDGLKIPALITWPAGLPKEQRKNLPLVVMPHGGPESYDAVGFDWLAQFIANEGYAVLQPNFRGSAGFGSEFRDAGRGEWGRKMQDDITDGAQALIKTGWADPSRVCIVGWSYGGYAALAGGALTPDLYKCVVSVAGVSDLRDMLASEKRQYGYRSLRVKYWENLIGDPDKDRAAIDAVSPARHADKFKAPVLLIHGADDTVVPSTQSNIMNDALKGAGKPVQYIRIKGDDHSLVENESRRTALQAISEFLAKHLK
jgi:dipeptidyl aminopeptidase/acylaminoacyl peptidase